MRHPGAGPFAHSSAVEVDVLVFWEFSKLLLEVVRLNPDGTLYASGIGVVVAVTAHIDDQDLVGTLRRKLSDELFHLDAGPHPVHSILAQQPDAIRHVHDGSQQQDFFNGMPSRLKTA